MSRLVLLSLGGLVLALVTVSTSVASLHRAIGSSDAPTIRSGAIILVNRLAYDLHLPLAGHRLARFADPERGDVVLFSMPGSGHFATKRVVAVPGDLVEMRAGRLVLNGLAAQYRTAVTAGNAPEDASNILIEEWGGTSHFVICSLERSATEASTVATVPAGHYFVVGDNRQESLDSRAFGPVPREAIQGRVMIRDRAAGTYWR